MLRGKYLPDVVLGNGVLKLDDVRLSPTSLDSLTPNFFQQLEAEPHECSIPLHDDQGEVLEEVTVVFSAHVLTKEQASLIRRDEVWEYQDKKKSAVSWT